MAFVIAAGKFLVHLQPFLGPLPNDFAHNGGHFNLNPLFLRAQFCLYGPPSPAATYTWGANDLRPDALFVEISITNVGCPLQYLLYDAVLPASSPPEGMGVALVEPLRNRPQSQLFLASVPGRNMPYCCGLSLLDDPITTAPFSSCGTYW